MVALSSGWMGTVGIVVEAPSMNASHVGNPGRWWRTVTSSTPSRSMRSSRRSLRSTSANSSLSPLSSMPYSSSSPDHQAFMATATQPALVMPMKAAIHSG